jgi:hypothetical protein
MSTQSLADTPPGYLLHGIYPVVDLSPQHLVSETATMAFNAGSFMEKIKASVQQIFDEFKVSMLEIIAEKGRGGSNGFSRNHACAARSRGSNGDVSSRGSIGGAAKIRNSEAKHNGCQTLHGCGAHWIDGTEPANYDSCSM